MSLLAESRGTPKVGEIVEVRWSAALVDDLSRWLRDGAQLGELPEMASPLAVANAAARRRGEIQRCVEDLGALLKRHQVPVMDLALALEIEGRLVR